MILLVGAPLGKHYERGGEVVQTSSGEMLLWLGMPPLPYHALSVALCEPMASGCSPSFSHLNQLACLSGLRNPTQTSPHPISNET
eukprot:c34770_g1_i1 orf=167-421(-)